MKVGRPKIISRRLCVGLFPAHDEYIELITQKTGRHDTDVVREALDLLIASRPAESLVSQASASVS